MPADMAVIRGQRCLHRALKARCRWPTTGGTVVTPDGPIPPPVLSLQARAALIAAFTTIAASPVTVALAAGTSTVKDPYGENTKLNLDQVSTNAAQAPGTGGNAIAKTIFGLGIVIAVIYGLTWVLRQLKASSEDSGFGGLKTEASMPLGPGRSVHLIRAGSELVLVGSAEHGVTPLRTYTEEEALDLGLIGGDEELGDGESSDRRRRSVLPGGVTRAVAQLRDRTLR